MLVREFELCFGAIPKQWEEEPHRESWNKQISPRVVTSYEHFCHANMYSGNNTRSYPSLGHDRPSNQCIFPTSFCLSKRSIRPVKACSCSVRVLFVYVRAVFVLCSWSFVFGSFAGDSLISGFSSNTTRGNLTFGVLCCHLFPQWTFSFFVSVFVVFC